jgi:DNA-binding HxlR family transcriptional regulator
MDGKRKLKNYNPEGCPVIHFLNLIGNRWKILIIYYVRNQNQRFTNLKNAIPQISRQTLTNQLREMEEDGILHRTVFPEIPPRVEYGLTDLGKSMIPVVNEMSKWGTTNFSNKKVISEELKVTQQIRSC